MRQFNRPFTAVAILLVALILGACQPLPAPLAVLATEENKALIRRGFEAFNTGDLDAFDELMGPDFVDHWPVPGQSPGIEGFKQAMAGFRAAFPDMECAIEDLIAEGDKVTALTTCRGTHDGEFAGMPPTGKQVAIEGIVIYRITDGKIVDRWGIFNDLSLMIQLGAIPPPGQAEANMALVRRAFEEPWNQGNLAAVDEIYASNYVGHVAGAEPVKGPEGHKQLITVNRTAFPDLHFTIEDMIAAGDKVVTRWTVRGTHDGELMGIPPTGRQIEFTGTDIHRIADGKVVEVWAEFNQLILMQQLGFELVPPPVAKAVTVLVRGSPLHSANGIMFDSDDRLYIPSILGRYITVMDPETGEILDRLGPDQGVEAPDDLAFGPDGSLYWTGGFTGEVGRVSPDGEKGTVAQLPPGANPITFSDDGRLFVALCFLGDALYEVDPNGVEEPRLIAENMGGGGCALNGMDWGPDGFLYGPRWFQGEVVRVDVDSGEFTTVADGIGVPAALKFDSQGRLHVLDTMRGQVLRVDIETGEKEVIATIMPGLDNLAFDSQDRLYVSSFTEGYIVEVLEDGTTRLVSEGGMIAPGGVAVLGGSVFVADLLSLKEFDRLTGEQQSIERDILGFSALGAPFTVSPDGDNLLVSSWFNNAVRVWNPETREVLEEHLDFAVPLNAIRFQGDLVVAELGTGSVVRTSAADPTERTMLVTGLGVPAGLAATDDDLWVSDWATGSVLQIVADGETLAKPIPAATGLAFPEGLAVAADGNLLVVESGAGRLLSINLETDEVSTVAEGLELGAQGVPNYPPTWIFNGVAVGPSGAIYVTGDIANVLYRIEPGP